MKDKSRHTETETERRIERGSVVIQITTEMTEDRQRWHAIVLAGISLILIRVETD